MNYYKNQQLVYNFVYGKCYSHDKLKYHTIHHIDTMLSILEDKWKEIKEEFPELTEKDYTELWIAICFHDSIYKPGDSKNEVNSANLFSLTFNFLDLDKKKIENLILSTIPFSDKINTPLEKILHDLDWLGFSDLKTATLNEGKIINEFVSAGYSNKECITGQKNFYKKLLEKIQNQPLYLTKTFASCNDSVKSVLENRISYLEKKELE